jgi:hypothetical protein
MPTTEEPLLKERVGKQLRQLEGGRGFQVPELAQRTSQKLCMGEGLLGDPVTKTETPNQAWFIIARLKEALVPALAGSAEARPQVPLSQEGSR